VAFGQGQPPLPRGESIRTAVSPRCVRETSQPNRNFCKGQSPTFGFISPSPSSPSLPFHSPLDTLLVPLNPARGSGRTLCRSSLKRSDNDFCRCQQGVGTGWAGWAVARPSIYNRGMATVIFGPPSI